MTFVDSRLFYSRLLTCLLSTLDFYSRQSLSSLDIYSRLSTFTLDSQPSTFRYTRHDRLIFENFHHIRHYIYTPQLENSERSKFIIIPLICIFARVTSAHSIVLPITKIMEMQEMLGINDDLNQGRQSVLKSEGDRLENEEVRGYMLP